MRKKETLIESSIETSMESPIESPTESRPIEKRKISRTGTLTRARVLWCLAAAGCGLWIVYHAVMTERAEHRMQEIRTSCIQDTEGNDMVSPSEVELTSGLTGQEAVKEKTMAPDPLEKYDVPPKEIDFVRLQEEQNPDIYAWITIPGTNVDYPVLQHPKEMDYYLSHNIDGSTGKPGCVYSQLLNSWDWSDWHTVLYGHNAQKGTVFGTLHYYEDPEFFAEHPYIYIYGEDKVLVYRIFAAHEHSDEHLLAGDICSPEDWQNYLEHIFTENTGDDTENSTKISGSSGNYDLETKLTSESRILTLSTCITSRWTKRWLVQAVLVAEGTLFN